MLERFDLRDEHGRISGYVLRETPNRAAYRRSGPWIPHSDPPTIEALCLIFGLVMLVATVALVWAMAMAG